MGGGKEGRKVKERRPEGLGKCLADKTLVTQM